MKKPLLILAALALVTPETAMTDALKLTLSGNGHSDEIVVRFDSLGTTAYNSNLDAWKLFSPVSSIGQLYTLCAPNEPLCVYAMPLSALDTVIALYSLVLQPGTYTLKGTEYGAFAPGECILLEDHQPSSSFDLRSGNTFSFIFSTMPQNAPARFRVHFKRPPAVALIHPKCYSSPTGSVLVYAAPGTNWSYTLLTSSNTVLHTNTHLSGTDTTSGLGSGSYLLQTASPGCSFQETVLLTTPPPVLAHFTPGDSITFLNPGTGIVFSNTSQNATNYLWTFGDQTASCSATSPTHVYSSPGTYTVTLVASKGGCNSSFSRALCLTDAVTGIFNQPDKGSIMVSQNGQVLCIRNSSGSVFHASVSIFGLDGKSLVQMETNNASTYEISLRDISCSIYLLRVESGETVITRKIARLTH